MKAQETKVENFLSTNKAQFVIPVYQRNYDWNWNQCKQLLDDLIEAGKNKKISGHFIGSIVYIHDDVYSTSRIKELTVIDGQQRLTTLTLIYASLVKLAKEIDDKSLVEELSETYLINKFAPENEKLKLRPTENNDKALKFILNSDDTDQFQEYSRVIENFNYFKKRITDENYRVILDGLSKLMFVEISLEREKDDPQRIFESLNSTGLELSQADLIRNYVLMGLKLKEQERVYKQYWEVIEKQAKDEKTNTSKVSEFMRDYLILKTKKIPNKNKVYTEYKSNYPITSIEELESNLKEPKMLVYSYNKLINPYNEDDNDIKLQLKYINKLEINVAYPFLMKVYDDYKNEVIDKSTFIDILYLIQSFTIRRFILGLPTNALNKIFMGLYEKVDPSNYLLSIQKTLLLKSGVQRFPKDAEVKDALKVKDVYNIKSKNRMYLFERLENYDNTEKVIIDGNPDITIEHIFPKNPDAKWKIELGADEFEYIKENYLNTIANLTLSGNNGKLGNKPFLDKRDLEEKGYYDSRLWLNKYLAKQEKWGIDEIEKRFNSISKRFLTIWKYPDVELGDIKESDEVNIFEADDPTHKKLDYAIFFDQKLEVPQVSKLYTEVFKELFNMQPDVFFTTDLGEKVGLTKDPSTADLRSPVQINNSYYIEAGYSNTSKFDRLKYALNQFGFEDELVIKYSDK